QVSTREKAMVYLEYFFMNIIKCHLSSTMNISSSLLIENTIKNPSSSSISKLIHINSFCELDNEDDNQMCEKVLNNIITVIQENSQNNNNKPIIVGETRMKLFENLHLLEI